MNQQNQNLLPLAKAVKKAVGSEEQTSSMAIGYIAKFAAPAIVFSALMSVSPAWAIDTLQTSVGGTAAGVVAAPANPGIGGETINCANTTLGSSGCVVNFASTTTLTLSASPNADAQFTGWSGTATGCSGIVTPISVTTLLNTTATCTANFAPIPKATLTAQVVGVTGTTGTGMGSITTSSPPTALTTTFVGNACTSTCVATYSAGTTIPLTATPMGTSVFTGWSGSATGCSGTMTTINVTTPVTTTSVDCKATFDPPAAPPPPKQRVHIFDTTTDLTVFQDSTNQLSPPNPATKCVNFGIVQAGKTSTKTFTVGSTISTSNPDPVTGLTIDQVTNIAFSPDPDLTFKYDTNTVSLNNLSGLTTTSKGNTGYFNASFTPPAGATGSATSATAYNRTLQVFTTDPLAKPIAIPVSAFVVPNTLPNVEVLDEAAVVVSSVTPIDFGTTTVGSPRTRTFTVKNSGFGLLNLLPTIPQFTGTGFSDGAYGKNTLNAPTPTATSSGCSNALGNFDSTTFTVKLNADAVGEYTGTVAVAGTAPDGVTPIVFKFPVKGAVVPPPPTQPEIDVYDGTNSLKHNTDIVDFGATSVGKPVIRTLTVKNPSTAVLTVFDFSANLPAGFSLVNPSYSSTIPPGGSVDLAVRCDAATAGSFGGQLRIPSNDADNGDGVENPFTINLKCSTSGGTTTTNALKLTVTGSGTVTSDTGGINCGKGGTICEAGFNAGTAVKLTATADTGATFAGWGGGCTGTANPLSVTIDAAKDCTATFTGGGGGTGTGGDISLEITPAPTGGSVSSDIPATGSINCGTTGTICKVSSYKTTDTVKLTATPDTGYTFTGWTGQCSGTISPVTVTMDSLKQCSATFTQSGGQPTTGGVVLAVLKPTGGTVKSDIPATGGINCGTGGTACTVSSYKTTDTVTLTATADQGFTFQSWGGDCSGTNSALPVTTATPKVCSATFSGGASAVGTIEVLEGTASIADGATTPIDFGTAAVGSPMKKTFTIKNSGSADLTLTAPTLPSGFSIIGTFPSKVAPNATANFEIQLDAKSAGTFTGNISFGNNDATKNPFDFAIKGTVNQQDTTAACFDQQKGIVTGGICTGAEVLIPGSSLGNQVPDIQIRGGISKNGGVFKMKDTVVLADTIATAGIIKVAPEDVGKKADIIVTGLHYSDMYPIGFAWYMLDGCKTCVKSWPYNERDALPVFAALRPLLTVSTLPAYLTVDMYAGHFVFPGFLDIFFGYRIAEGADQGKVIFNATPINVNINP